MHHRRSDNPALIHRSILTENKRNDRRSVTARLGRAVRFGRAVAPGLALCLAVTFAAMAIERAEEALFGRAWLEALVLAILLGTAIRTAWTPTARWRPGLHFSARTLLEIAVVLLGASLSTATIAAAGPSLLAGIAGVVFATIVVGYAVGRALRLPHRMSVLIACGNAICGNSAIAAVAPVIDADSDDVVAAIAFTAVLGILVVLALPLLIPALGLSATQYGILSGLTVYAVPQVVAATTPAGAVAVQIGTLVKLVRVLMLGPVVVVLSTLSGRLRPASHDRTKPVPAARRRVSLGRLVPWFILAFLGVAGLRSAGLIPAMILPAISRLATVLTIVSMAALGLGVDIRTVAEAGLRVTAAVTLSLLALAALSYALIRVLGIT